MEALVSRAAYSYEHPRDRFPEFVDASAGPLFDGQELGHPLIEQSRCVPNSVCLDHQNRILMVSGSNMSGKSTYLRVVGVNAVLAMAGAPIRGQALRLSPLVLGTRLRTTDSLQESRSGFYTEILRIRQVFDLTAGEILGQVLVALSENAERLAPPVGQDGRVEPEPDLSRRPVEHRFHPC